MKSNIFFFHITKFTSDLAQTMLEEAESKDGARVLETSKAFEKFALEYAEHHLNDTNITTIIKGKLGKFLN